MILLARRHRVTTAQVSQPTGLKMKLSFALNRQETRRKVNRRGNSYILHRPSYVQILIVFGQGWCAEFKHFTALIAGEFIFCKIVDGVCQAYARKRWRIDILSSELYYLIGFLVAVSSPATHILSGKTLKIWLLKIDCRVQNDFDSVVCLVTKQDVVMYCQSLSSARDAELSSANHAAVREHVWVYVMSELCCADLDGTFRRRSIGTHVI